MIADEESARAAPELSVLSAMAHGRGERGLEVALAALKALADLDDEYTIYYHDLVMAGLSSAVRKALEEMMFPEGYEFQSDFAKEHFGKGKAEGKAEGVLMILAARGLEVNEDARRRILSCVDFEQLDEWIRRAATASSTEDVFDERTPSS